MISDRTELMLEEISRYSSRITLYTVCGFVIGLLIGMMAAWLLIAR